MSLSVLTLVSTMALAEPLDSSDPFYDYYQVGDNDWSGSTYEFGGNYSSGSWRYRPGSSSYYLYGDIRYSSSSTAKYGWWWNSEAGSDTRANFWAWIPYSSYATATVQYTMMCTGSTSKTKSVNQNDYGGEWVYLGYVSVDEGNNCGLEVKKTSSSGYVAADGVALLFGT